MKFSFASQVEAPKSPLQAVSKSRGISTSGGLVSSGAENFGHLLRLLFWGPPLGNYRFAECRSRSNLLRFPAPGSTCLLNPDISKTRGWVRAPALPRASIVRREAATRGQPRARLGRFRPRRRCGPRAGFGGYQVGSGEWWSRLGLCRAFPSLDHLPNPAPGWDDAALPGLSWALPWSRWCPPDAYRAPSVPPGDHRAPPPSG